MALPGFGRAKIYFFVVVVRRPRGRGPNFRIVLFWLGTKARRTTFGLGTASDRLGTDRHRSRQRTATIGVFGFATVYLVRHALAGIERATCWTDRLAVCADGFLWLSSRAFCGPAGGS